MSVAENKIVTVTASVIIQKDPHYYVSPSHWISENFKLNNVTQLFFYEEIVGFWPSIFSCDFSSSHRFLFLQIGLFIKNANHL